MGPRDEPNESESRDPADIRGYGLTSAVFFGVLFFVTLSIGPALLTTPWGTLVLAFATVPLGLLSLLGLLDLIVVSEDPSRRKQIVFLVYLGLVTAFFLYLAATRTDTLDMLLSVIFIILFGEEFDRWRARRSSKIPG